MTAIIHPTAIVDTGAVIGNDTKALIELMAASPNRIFKVADLNKHLNANPAYDKPQHHVNNLMSTLKRNKFVVKIARGQYRINRTKLGTVKFETPKHATP